MLNSWCGLGNLTRDPELKYTPSGKAVAEFGMALNKVWTDGNGQKQEKTIFLNLTAWGNDAENIAKFFHKGEKIAVQGELDMDSWDDKQTGQKRTAIKIVVRSWAFCGSKTDGNGQQGAQPQEHRQPQGQGQRPQQQRQASPAGRQAAPPPEEEADCPF